VLALLSCGLAPYVLLDVWNIYVAQTVNTSVEIEAAIDHEEKMSLIEAMQAILNGQLRVPATAN